MKSVLATESAILLELKSVRIIFLVLLCVVVSLLALRAHKSYLDSYIISHDCGTSHFKIFDSGVTGVRVPPSGMTMCPAEFGADKAQQKKPTHRGRIIIPLRKGLVNSFFEIWQKSGCQRRKPPCFLEEMRRFFSIFAYLYFLLRAASDFFLRFTLGFS